MSISTSDRIRVLVWGENRHEQIEPHVAAIYPDGMHTTIAAGIADNLGDRARVRTTTLDEPEHGLTDEVLDDLDVLVWWGHAAHGEVSDEVVDRVHRHVLSGLGLVVLHSGHWSKIFGKLMGTTCTLRWRSAQDRELVWTVDPTHPITEGVPSPIVIDAQEMYGEFFDIPAPDELIFISSFTGGEVFRSGCTFRRGHGRIFYFSPGDQDYPVYHHTDVRRVIANGVAWAHNDRPRTAADGCSATRRTTSSPGTTTRARSRPTTTRTPMPSPTEPVRLIVVGAGMMGRSWLDVIAQSADVQLVGVVDLDLGTAAAGGRGLRLPGGSHGHHPGRTRRPDRGRRGDQRDDPRSARRRQHERVAERDVGAVRKAGRRHDERGPVHGRGRGGERPAADGLPVPPLLAQPGGPARAGRPARPARHRRVQLLPRAPIRRVPRTRCRIRCWATWPSTISTSPAT